MTILAVCDSLDLAWGGRVAYGLWQLFKGLYELGHTVTVVPVRGVAPASPWWGVSPSPCRFEGQALSVLRRFAGGGAAEQTGAVAATRLSRGFLDTWLRPRLEQGLAAILAAEPFDALLVCAVPAAWLAGAVGRLRERSGIPAAYLDLGMPSGLPGVPGAAGGPGLYEAARLDEYDVVLGPSEGAREALSGLGAVRFQPLPWCADPEYWAPMEVPADVDVLFCGGGVAGREGWLKALLVEPSLRMPEARFVCAGRGFDGERGKAAFLGEAPLHRRRRLYARTRIALDVVRESVVAVAGSTTPRLFQLAALGCCIVTHPRQGIDSYFEPEREVVVVHTWEEAVECYRALLDDESRRHALGQAARNTLLARHTHRHRAAELVQALQRR